MSTLSDILTKVRYKARDDQGVEFTDSLALAFANTILSTIHQHLVNVESNLVYNQASISLADGTAEYDLGVSHDGVLKKGVWLEDSTVPLDYIQETDLIAVGLDPTATGEPRRYYVATNNQIGFHPIPDSDAAGQTVNILYWEPVTELTAVGDTLPWHSIWDRVIEYWLLFDFMERRESDTTRVAALLDQFWSKAINQVYERGVRRWGRQNRLATAEGV